MSLVAALASIGILCRFALASNWPQYGFDVRHNSVSDETWLTAANASTLTLKWSADVLGSATSHPAVVNDTVYIETLAAIVSAYDLKTGQRYWRRDLSSTMYGTPLYLNGRLYVEDRACRMYALNASTGAILWSTQVGDSAYEAFQGSVAYDRGRLYGGVSSFTGDDPCSRGRVVAFDAETGTPLWAWYAVDDTSLGGGVWLAQAVDTTTGNVYAVTGNPCVGEPGPYTDAIVCLDGATGALIWSWQANPGDFQDRDFGCTPTLFETQDSTGTPVAAVAAGSKDGNLYALNRTTGQPLWTDTLAASSWNVGDIGVEATATHWNGTLIVGTGITVDGFPGSITCVDAATGALRWRHTTTAALYQNVAVANGVLLAAGGGGTLLALNAATGDSLWGTNVGGSFTFAGPSVSDGYILMPFLDNRLYAFSLPGTLVAVGDARTGEAATANRVALRAWVDARGVVQLTGTGTGADGARVSVFDAAGRRVTSLTLTGNAGTGQATWDPTSGGTHVARGIYVARIDGTGVTARFALAPRR